MVEAFPTYLKDCLDLWTQGLGNMDSGDAYSRLQFNEYGDNIFDRPTLTSEDDLMEVHIPEIGEETILRINELNSYVKSKGATLLITAYPTPVVDATPSYEEYVDFSDKIEALVDCPVISRYEEYRMESKYFYNTYLHLNNEGVTLRTNMLIADLQKYLEN